MIHINIHSRTKEMMTIDDNFKQNCPDTCPFWSLLVILELIMNTLSQGKFIKIFCNWGENWKSTGVVWDRVLVIRFSLIRVVKKHALLVFNIKFLVPFSITVELKALQIHTNDFNAFTIVPLWHSSTSSIISNIYKNMINYITSNQCNLPVERLWISLAKWTDKKHHTVHTHGL